VFTAAELNPLTCGTNATSAYASSLHLCYHLNEGSGTTTANTGSTGGTGALYGTGLWTTGC
jgi:hypothetical protein